MGDVRMGRGCELCWLLGSWTMRIRTQLGSGRQTISSQGEWAEKSLLPLGKHVLGSGEDTHRGVSVLLRSICPHYPVGAGEGQTDRWHLPLVNNGPGIES